MKKLLFTLLLTLSALSSTAIVTIPIQGTIISPANPHIQYAGRISFANPERPAWNFPGIQIMAAFEGTSLKMMAKPQSGYFMAQIDEAEPFKVAFRGERDSLVTIATALPEGRHFVHLMYIIEGYELFPEFWGFVLDKGCRLVEAPAFPSRKIEFIGNSITCAYGNESTNPNDHFEYETENHYLGYAQQTTRNLGAVAYVVARSGIGVYREYGGPKTGTPKNVMTTEYEYTNLYDRSEKWDFSRYQPQVVCINLGTNDLSTNNYDVKLFKQAWKKFLSQVRQHNPKAKIVLLCGSMLQGKELEIAKNTLNEVMEEAKKDGDKEVYRFDFTPQNGSIHYGADWHPSYWQHQKMAGELTAFLRSLMQWF